MADSVNETTHEARHQETHPPIQPDAAAPGYGDTGDRRPSHRTGTLTVADMLDLPILQRARPQVLAGTGLAERAVRWVHTSEIYEISPLLKGGEVLLTTGLGLVGAGPSALRDYVTRLAERSIAALVLEVGRTFTSAPEPLVRAARESGLPLITLSGIVPFIEITESVHTLLLTDEVSHLRLSQRIASELTAVLLAGDGLIAILRTIAATAECPVRLYAADGHLVAASEDAGDTADPQWQASAAAVELFGRRWGRLVIHGEASQARSIAAEHGARAVALELGRTGGSGGRPSRRRAGAILLRDIFGRQYSSVEDITGRAAALGLVIPPDGRGAGICLAVDPAGTTATTAAVATAADQVLGVALTDEIDGSYLIAATVGAGDLRSLIDKLADAVDAELPTGRCVAVTCGPTVRTVGALAQSLRVAREASVLARRLHSELRTLLATDLGVHRLLGRFASDPELATFVEEQLGTLLDYDAAHGRDLVRTLDTLLSHALSKAATARALGIRRQTLYQRLEKISTLLGGLDLDSRERRTAMDLALVGWRLRAAAIAGNP